MGAAALRHDGSARAGRGSRAQRLLPHGALLSRLDVLRLHLCHQPLRRRRRRQLFSHAKGGRRHSDDDPGAEAVGQHDEGLRLNGANEGNARAGQPGASHPLPPDQQLRVRWLHHGGHRRQHWRDGMRLLGDRAGRGGLERVQPGDERLLHDLLLRIHHQDHRVGLRRLFLRSLVPVRLLPRVLLAARSVRRRAPRQVSARPAHAATRDAHPAHPSHPEAAQGRQGAARSDRHDGALLPLAAQRRLAARARDLHLLSAGRQHVHVRRPW